MTPQILRRDVPPCALSSDLPPILRRVYSARGVLQDDDLDLSLARLLTPGDMKGVDAGAALLATRVEAGARVLVLADFDADGATSAALMVRGLRALGADGVDYLVPDRFRFGYGLTPEIVEVAAERGPDLIITVDNGISSVEGVRRARELGIPVLVTDHHLPGERLPDAEAIVNPNQPGCNFPSKCIAGVGVAFYLLSALRAELHARDWFSRRGIEPPRMADLLDLVALGTVADVVPLDTNNRILVREGLARVRAGRTHAGIEALLAVSGRERARVVASDLAFAVAPRLNAAGRLEDMSLGIECLLADDPVRARELAARLDALNAERREIEEGMKAQADAYLERFHPDRDTLPHGVCLFHADWHQGVVGILASRIREMVNRPVVAFAAGEGDASGELRGSARSVPGFHIRDALESMATRYPGLIMKFGGHAMAAGVTVARYKLDKFREAFEEQARMRLSANDLQGILLSDGELGPGEFHLEVARMLRDAGPWGEGFPEPLFDGVFEITYQQVIGSGHLRMRVKPACSDQQIDAIFFKRAQPSADKRVRLAYRLDVNDYRGRESVQLIVEAMLPESGTHSEAPA